MEMTSLKPYLIRSIYEWILDNSCTPYIAVSTLSDEVVVPWEFVEDDRIVLNLNASAVQGLALGDQVIEFNARFSGKPMRVTFPVNAVITIYAKENGQGMFFEENSATVEAAMEEQPSENRPPERKKPQLSIVK